MLFFDFREHVPTFKGLNEEQSDPNTYILDEDEGELDGSESEFKSKVNH